MRPLIFTAKPQIQVLYCNILKPYPNCRSLRMHSWECPLYVLLEFYANLAHNYPIGGHGSKSGRAPSRTDRRFGQAPDGGNHMSRHSFSRPNVPDEDDERCAFHCFKSLFRHSSLSTCSLTRVPNHFITLIWVQQPRLR
jgi:hypothetical protein